MFRAPAFRSHLFQPTHTFLACLGSTTDPLLLVSLVKSHNTNITVNGSIVFLCALHMNSQADAE